MRYFITEEERKKLHATCYFEFQKGKEVIDHREYLKKPYKIKCGCWKDDSLLLHMDIADEIGLYKLVPEFAYYAVTIVDSDVWQKILQNALRTGGKAAEVIEELTPWADESITKYGYFIICGI